MSLEKRRHTEAVRLRLLPDQDKLIRKAADMAGISVSAWVRDRLVQVARRELAKAKRQGA